MSCGTLFIRLATVVSLLGILGQDTARAAIIVETMSYASVCSDTVNGQQPTTMIFDDYVPNSVPVNNQDIASYSDPFMGFFDGIGSGSSVGVIVEDSSGTVTFSDWTSMWVTSDIRSNRTAPAKTLTLRFVSPSDSSVPASVSRLAFPYGGVAQPIGVSFYDSSGALIDTATFASSNGKAGFVAKDGTDEVSAIQKVVFSPAEGDWWLLGSFAYDPASTVDLAFNGFQSQAIPAPSALVGLVGMGLTGLVIRRLKRRQARGARA